MVALTTGLAFALLSAEPARGGTVTSRSGCAAEGRVCGSETVYRALPGERNEVTVEAEPGAVVVTDAGASVVAGGACQSLDAHRARCRIGPIGPSAGGQVLVVRLGDLDDRASSFVAGTFYGEGGDDVVSAAATGSLYGGAGADILTGSEGIDYLDGGRGRDVIDGRGSPADAISSGDTVVYRDRDAPVIVDLTRGIGGEAGEGDVLRGVEHVQGGRRADVLVGGDGPTSLEGGRGDDLLQGGGGDDLLVGAEGDDRIEGGAGRDRAFGDEGSNRLLGGGGDDHLHPGDARGTRSRAACGPGRDAIGPTVPTTLVGEDCERVTVGFLNVKRLPIIGRRQAIFRITHCHDDACRAGAVVLAARGRRIGTGRQRGRRIVVRYNARGRQLLGRARSGLVVRVQWRGRGEGTQEGYSTRWPEPVWAADRGAAGSRRDPSSTPTPRPA